jgi:8-oxo-dGTP diphosphatase
MSDLPYRIAVLCYLYDEDGNTLLLHRAKQPNQHRYSPVGGKLEMGLGESPWHCARREIEEETGLCLTLDELRLQGMVSETAYEGDGHWLLFLFVVTRPVRHDEIASMEFDEGTLEWVDPDKVKDLRIPESDQRVIWPLVRKHQDGFFAVHIDCRDTPFSWTMLQEPSGNSPSPQAGQ